MDNDPATLITKTGRLDIATRLAFMGRQMMTGLQVFWNKNKVWIIAALVAALIAAGLIAFFTGGAGLVAAVDIIVKAMIIIFGAYAVYQALGHIWDYVKKAWAGDAVGAGKSLAMAMAVIVMEFLLDKILLGMGKVFKRVMAAAKATKFGQKVVKGVNYVRRGATKVGNVVKKGVARVKNTRLAIRIQGMVGKGTKKLSNLRQKILEKFKFKRIWFQKRGKWIELWAEFNPKYMLTRQDADGNDQVELHDIRSGDANRTVVKNTDGTHTVTIDGQSFDAVKVPNKKVTRTDTLDPTSNLSSRKRQVTNADGTKTDVVYYNQHGVNEDLIPVFPNRKVPSNARKYAGRDYPLEGSLKTKYGDGVPYTKDGFPDFEAVLRRKRIKSKKVEIEMSGDSAADIRAANKEAFGRSTTDKSVQTGFENYTWHHSHDGKHMILVPTDLHDAARHFGGDTITRARLGI
jgi:hypothetical protein